MGAKLKEVVNACCVSIFRYVHIYSSDGGEATTSAGNSTNSADSNSSRAEALRGLARLSVEENRACTQPVVPQTRYCPTSGQPAAATRRSSPRSRRTSSISRSRHDRRFTFATANCDLVTGHSRLWRGTSSMWGAEALAAGPRRIDLRRSKSIILPQWARLRRSRSLSGKPGLYRIAAASARPGTVPSFPQTARSSCRRATRKSSSALKLKSCLGSWSPES